MTATPNCLVIPHFRPAAAHRLVVFPHAGGGASFYRSWGGLAGEDIEVQIVQYSGRETRMAEPPISDLGTLVGEVSAALRETDDGRVRTALFGHSMGAIIAHETALALESTGGIRLTDLFVSARRAPGSGGESPEGQGSLRLRTDDEILESLQRHGGTPMVLFDDPGVREIVLRALRNDYLLIDSYRPPAEPVALTAGITALWSHQDTSVDEDSVRRWSRFTRGGFREHVFEGGHFYLVPQAERVVELVREQLRPREGLTRK